MINRKKILLTVRRYKKRFSFIVKFVTGGQYLNHPIGKVSLPVMARPFLKRSVAQQGEDLVLDRIITRILKWDIYEPRYYVDVGAYHPIDHSVTYLLYRRRWVGIAFDPSQETHNYFKLWRRRDQFVQAVVGDVDGVDVDFYVPGDGFDMSNTNTKYPSKNSMYIPKKMRQINLNSELERPEFVS